MWRSHTKKWDNFGLSFCPKTGVFFRGWGLFQICGQFSRWFLGFLRKKANRWRCLWHCQKWLIVQDLTFTAVIENSYMEFRICELQLVPQLVQLVDISCKKKNMRQAGQRHMFLPTYPENCPLFWKNPSPSEENIHFGGEIKSEIVPFFLYGLVTYMTGIFLKKIGQNRSVLPSAVPKRIYPRLCGVATTN